MRILLVLLCLSPLGLWSMATQAQTPSHAFGLHAAPQLPADFSAFPYVNPDAPKGGSVTLGAIGNFDSFNPFILRGTPAIGTQLGHQGAGNISMVWDTLMRPSDSEPDVLYGHLASAITVSSDSVSFDLRPEARFHDGTPVTAQDAVWTFNALRDQGRPFYKQYYADVVSAEARSPTNLVFHIRPGASREVPYELGELPVLPEHWWKGRDFAAPLTEPPLGSGPYVVKNFEFGREVVFARAPDYWAANLPTARGLFNFDTIRVEYFRDLTVAMEAFKAGQVDIREENVAKNWATAYDFPAVHDGLVKLAEMPHHLPTYTQGFALNTRRDIFRDPRVREALDDAFDFEWMNKTLFYGAYTRTASYFANTPLASSGVPAGAELALLEPYRAALPARLFTEPYRLPVTDGTGNNRPQLRAALDLLAAAGWKITDRKLLDAGGRQMRFTILLADPLYERMALPFKASLERLGMDVSVRTVDPAQYQHLMDSFDYDVTIAAFPATTSPGNEQRGNWGCASAKEQGSENIMGVCDKVVDALVDQVINARDWDHLLVATHALDRVLLWGWYMVPNFHSTLFRVAYWERFGRPAQATRSGYVFDSWWVEPGLAAATDAARGGMH